MRSSKSRSRSKSSRQRSLGNVVNRVFDSSGPEGKVRGTPQQIIEKYLTLARDAQLSHDRVAEQSFLQHAEHYTRMLGEAQREVVARPGQNPQYNRQEADGGYSNHGYGTGHNASNHSGHGQNNGQNGNHNGNHNGGQNQNGQRDNQGENQGGQPSRRDAPRDQPPRQPRHEQTDQPATPEVVEDVVPQTSLPDAVNAGDEDTSVPVNTPETEAEPAAKPARTRSSRPRTPRSTTGTTTTRSRRKPVAEDGAAPAADAPAPAPTQSSDQD
ncbi:MAG: DUF4167 domain-containing protein [Paracoccus sp. (in: a-proteobacteria)]|nr:DUF4167 domain-containing protein [Paracoccus sp. (in: a-proteobacteria)]